MIVANGHRDKYTGAAGRKGTCRFRVTRHTGKSVCMFEGGWSWLVVVGDVFLVLERYNNKIK